MQPQCILHRAEWFLWRKKKKKKRKEKEKKRKGKGKKKQEKKKPKKHRSLTDRALKEENNTN